MLYQCMKAPVGLCQRVQRVILRPNPALLPKVLSDLHLNQSVELHPFFLPHKNEEMEWRQSLICPVRTLSLSIYSGQRHLDKRIICLYALNQSDGVGHYQGKTIALGCRNNPDGLQGNRQTTIARTEGTLERLQPHGLCGGGPLWRRFVRQPRGHLYFQVCLDFSKRSLIGKKPNSM